MSVRADELREAMARGIALSAEGHEYLKVQDELDDAARDAKLASGREVREAVVKTARECEKAQTELLAAVGPVLDAFELARETRTAYKSAKSRAIGLGVHDTPTVDLVGLKASRQTEESYELRKLLDRYLRTATFTGI